MVLHVFRALASEHYYKLTAETWELLLDTLNREQFLVLQYAEHKNSGPHHQHVNVLLAETLLVTWIRSQTRNEQFWHLLKDAMVRHHERHDFIKVWSVRQPVQKTCNYLFFKCTRPFFRASCTI